MSRMILTAAFGVAVAASLLSTGAGAADSVRPGAMALKGEPGKGGLFAVRGDAVDVVVRPDQLLPLFLAVFPDADVAAMAATDEIGGTRYQAAPVLAFATADGVVLVVSETDPSGVHAASGGHSAYYLRADGAGYDVVGSYPLFDVSGGWGVPGQAAPVVVAPDQPAMTVISGYGNQGVSCGGVVVYTFDDAGPHASSDIPLYVDDSSGMAVAGGGAPTTVEGVVQSIDGAAGVTIRYTGVVGWDEARGRFSPGPVDMTVTIPLSMDQTALWEAYPLQC